jgi:hypothetical protein
LPSEFSAAAGLIDAHNLVDGSPFTHQCVCISFQFKDLMQAGILGGQSARKLPVWQHPTIVAIIWFKERGAATPMVVAFHLG